MGLFPTVLSSATHGQVAALRQTGDPAPAPWMGIGAAVTLLPVDLDSGFLRGQITHWLGAAGNAVATIGVRTSPETATLCSGHRLWLCGHEAVNDNLLVLEVVAKRPPRFVDTALALTSVVSVAQEPRRAAIRATVRHPVRIGLADGTLTAGVVDDLSRTGCRIALNDVDLMPRIGSTVGVLIELPGEAALPLAGTVVRTSQLAAEIAVRFQPAEIDLAPIDRLVYATVRDLPAMD
jgi:hypothetical protein